MEMEIKWETEFEKAKKRAKAEGKLIFLDYFDPKCSGCQQMEKCTYLNEAVRDFINNEVIPLRVPLGQEPLCSNFNINFTPARLLLDQDGNEHDRTVGYLPVDELVPAILLGIGHAYVHESRYHEALE